MRPVMSRHNRQPAGTGDAANPLEQVVENPTDLTDDEVQAFIDQARWLIEYHSQRGDAVITRSVALLGFTGVMLALVANLIGRNPASDWFVKLALAGTLVALLLAAVNALLAIKTRHLEAPAIAQLRRNWDGWVHEKRRKAAAFDVAESLLKSSDLTSDSVVESVRNEAESRAQRLNCAAWSMLASVVLLTVSVIDLYFRAFW